MLNVVGISEGSEKQSDREHARARFLHVVPTLTLFRSPLWRPRAIRGSEIGLSVSVLGLKFSTTDGGLSVRRIYPNRGYLVAGAGDRRQGFVVDIPGGVDHVSVEYLWTLPGRFGLPALRHEIGIALCGSGAWHSMCAVNWPREAFAQYEGDPAPLYVNPVTHLDHLRSSYGDFRSLSVGMEDGVRVVRERMALYGASLESMPMIDAFER